MHMQKSNIIGKKIFATNRGLVKTVVLVVAGLLLMAYLGFNLHSIVESKTFTDNLEFMRNLAITIWENYSERCSNVHIQRYPASVYLGASSH